MRSQCQQHAKKPRQLLSTILLLYSSLLSVTVSESSTTKELLWTGCGISKLGFMQDLG